MKVSHACVLLLACAHSALAGRATLAKVGNKLQVAFPPPPSVAPAPPVEPIPVPGAPPAASFTTPGLEFGLNVVGYNAAAFTPALQTTLCNAITAASGITGASFLPCTVTGVVSLADPTQAAVYGYAAVQWYSAPTTTQRNFATAQIATLLQGLATNTSGIFAGTNLTVTPNCACDGNAPVTSPSTQAFGYSTIIGSNLPGALCDAVLAPTPSVGVDNGSVSPANRGKFCSSPQLVVGGVAGTPGTGSCAIYGVSTGVTSNTAKAVVDDLVLVGATVTNPGSGYSSVMPTFSINGGSGGSTTTTVSVDSLEETSAATYTGVPTVIFTGTGTPATATVSMGLYTSSTPIAFPSPSCPIGTYKVIVSASYTTAPVVSVTVGGSATAVLTVSSNGAGFSSIPTAYTVVGCPGASVSSANFVLKVNSIQVVNGGAYTTMPTAVLTGGGVVPSLSSAVDVTVKVASIAASGGSFQSVPALFVTGPGLTPATATALLGVGEVTVTSSGSGYTAAPTVTFSQGGGAGAAAQAVVVSGGVRTPDGLIVTAPGSGYLSLPTITFSTPVVASTIGQLCAAPGSFIPAAGSLPAVGIEVAAGADSTCCAPIAIDTIAARPCSSPQLAAAGIIGVPGVATCGVVSSFVPSATATIAATTCALIPQAFTTTVTPGKASPSPASPAAPSPKAPAPSPAAPACTYGGNYRMEAVGRAACGVEFPSYYGGTPANQTLCTTQSIQLRTEKQLPKVDRATFELASTGEIKTVRRGCGVEAVWTPEGEKLRLLTTTTPKWKIEASAGDCNLVAIKSTATGTAAPYVSSPSPSGTQGCKSRQLFMTDKIYDTGRQLFRLRKV